MHPDDGREISNFIVQALTGHPITIYGKGEQTRSFCYVDDLVDGLMRRMESDAVGAQPVNLGNPGEVTVIGVARSILELTGSNSALEHQPMPGDDPARRCPDIRLAQSRLGWTPTVALDDGLVRTIDYFRR